MVTLIRKRWFEFYYLKQRFALKEDEDAYIKSEYHLKQRKNFLSLGNRWKLTKNEEYVFID